MSRTYRNNRRPRKPRNKRGFAPGFAPAVPATCPDGKVHPEMRRENTYWRKVTMSRWRMECRNALAHFLTLGENEKGDRSDTEGEVWGEAKNEAENGGDNHATTNIDAPVFPHEPRTNGHMTW